MSGADRDGADERPRHPIFDRVNAANAPRDAIGAIVERRVADGRAEGLFDDLAGTGKPIPDLDRPRRPGWWAERFVKAEKAKVERERLEIELERAMAPLWRLDEEAAVMTRIAHLNARIDRHNQTTLLDPIPRLDAGDMLTTWGRLRQTM